MLQPRLVGGEERTADAEKADQKDGGCQSVAWTASAYFLPVPGTKMTAAGSFQSMIQ